MELLSKIVAPTVLVFLVSTMLSAGLSLTLREILSALRDFKLVSLTLLGNLVLMPLGAVVFTRLMRLAPPLSIAVLLLGAAAGAPFLPKLVVIAKGNLALAVGMMVLLMVFTVGYIPLVLPWLVEGVSGGPMKVARSLVLFMLLPLGLGLAVKPRFERFAERARRRVDVLSSASLAVVLVLLLITNIQNVATLFGSRGVLASIFLIVWGGGIGWVLGGAEAGTRGVLALGTAQRNIGAALVIAEEDFHDPKVVMMIVLIAFVGFLILIPFALAIAKRKGAGTGRLASA